MAFFILTHFDKNLKKLTLKVDYLIAAYHKSNVA